MKIMINVLLMLSFLILSYLCTGKISAGAGLGWQWRGTSVSLIDFSLVAGATLSGALLGVLYEYLDRSQDDSIAWWQSVGQAFRSRRFGLTLCASPIMILFIFDQLHSQSIDLGVSLFCMQNGFFWDRTLKTLARGRSILVAEK